MLSAECRYCLVKGDADGGKTRNGRGNRREWLTRPAGAERERCHPSDLLKYQRYINQINCLPVPSIPQCFHNSQTCLERTSQLFNSKKQFVSKHQFPRKYNTFTLMKRNEFGGTSRKRYRLCGGIWRRRPPDVSNGRDRRPESHGWQCRWHI